MLYVPGVFWDEKPDLRREYATEWGVQMSYIEPFQHKKLALNLPLPVDGYWNFGVYGVVLVGLIFGLVIGFLEMLSSAKSLMSFSLGMALFVSIHTNNHLGATVADLPAMIFLICMLVVAMNLVSGVPRIARMSAKAPLSNSKFITSSDESRSISD